MKIKNKLTDLNNHLFEQLEKLTDAEPGEELELELKRAKAVASIASNIIDNGNLMLDTMKFMDENGYTIETEIKPQVLLGVAADDNEEEKNKKV